ncbi:MAG: AAA family ATPase [Myxococcota bacterium]|nr:AAA family ATPase [Myxococcota bacterium]
MLRFDRCRLDPERRELSVAERPVELQPKAFSLLTYLATNAERVVSKQELLEEIWDDVSVTESSLTRAMSLIRTTLRDAGCTREVVKTVRGLGYAMAVPVEEGAGAPPGPRARPRSADLVGRDAEIGALEAWLAHVREGQGGFVLLSGDPGIGKTRLIRELCMRAEDAGIEVFASRASEVEGRVSYGLWLELLAGIGRRRDIDLEARLGPAAGDVANVAPWLLTPREAPVRLEAAEERVRLFHALAGLFQELASEQPLLLVMEDLHWADPGSLRLLAFLSDRAGRVPMGVAGTHRSFELHPNAELEACAAELLRGAPETLQLALGSLEPDEVAELLERLSGRAPTPSEMRRVVSDTGGNPLFVREWIQLPEEQKSAPGRATPLPAGVRRVLHERLSALPDETHALLRTAAVCGQVFLASRLASTAEAELGTVLAALQPAELGRILQPATSPGSFEFVHALFREALLAELTTLGRLEAHRSVGLAIEATASAHSEPPLLELAHHFHSAASLEPERARRYLAEAAHQAVKRLAFEDAAGLVERLVALEEEHPERTPEGQLELRITLSELRYRAGDAAGAREDLDRALEIAMRMDAPRHAAIALTRLSNHMQDSLAGVPKGRLAHGERLLSRLGDDPQIQVELLAAVADDLYFDSLDRSRAMSTQAIELARSSGARMAHAYAIGARYRQLTHPDDQDERLALTREAERLSDEGLRDRNLSFYAVYNRLGVQLTRAQGEEAEQSQAELVRLARESRAAHHSAHVGVVEVGMALLHGDLEAVAERGEEVRRAVSNFRSRDEGFLAQAVQFGTLRMLQGQLAELLPIFENGIRSYPDMPAFRAGRMMASIQQGDLDAARRDLELLVPEGFRDFRRDFTHGVHLALCTTAASVLRDRVRAEALYACLAPYRSHQLNLDVFASYGSGDRHLAVLARCLGRSEFAIEHLRDALGVEERARAHLHRTRSCLELAQLLDERGAEGDREEALRLRETASDLSRRFGRGWSEESVSLW